MKIQVKQARELHNALVSVTSGTHAVATKLANGETSTAQVPYELDDKARWNLVKNLTIAERIVKNADQTREGIVRELTGGVGKDIRRADEPEKFQQYVERVTALEETVESAPFLRVKASGLKIANTNPIPGVIVTALTPILELDIPAEQNEVIPD